MSDGLRRELGVRDGTLLTIGAIVGTGIFLTPADVAAALPHAGLIILVWLAGGVLTLAGALTYGELGAMFPRAGGLYHFLNAAYGPVAGFLYGWTAFLVIMSGGIAAIAAGFAKYLGGMVPWFSEQNVLASASLGGWTWRFSGATAGAVAAIALLTAVNVAGVRAGARVQNALTALKIAAILGLFALGFTRAPLQAVDLAAPLPQGGLVAALGVSMIAVLWAYDGWYGLTFAAGALRRPERTLPRSLILGTAAVAVLYLLLNLIYLRALPLDALASSPRVAEDAVAALLGSGAARLASAAILVSAFGCLAATILYSSRIYQPMAADGVFFRRLAAIDQRSQVPIASLVAQSAWAIALACSGTFTELTTYVVFASVSFHAATGAAVFVLRRKQPDAPRPYRALGYPVVPALFVAASLALMVNTLIERPREALAGCVIVALGGPAYAAWSRRTRRRPLG